MTQDVKPYVALTQLSVDWWKNWIEKNGDKHTQDSDEQDVLPGNRTAARAALRRIRSIYSVDDGWSISAAITQAFPVPAYWDFKDRLDKLNGERKDPIKVPSEKLVMAAVVLAQVKMQPEHSDSVAKQMAAAKSGSTTPLLAEMRFNRLMRTGEDELPALLNSMIQAMQVLRETTNVGDLGASLLLWGPWVRQRWATDYWKTRFGKSDNNRSSADDTDDEDDADAA